MTFNSLQYLGFLALVVALHWALPRRARVPLLVVTSYVFYAAWDVRFLALIVGVSAVDWAVGRALERVDDGRPGVDRLRRRLLLVSIVVDLGVLAVFKYAGFFTEEAGALLERVGLATDPAVLRLVLPVGISFITFQSLSYVIDVYRRELPAVRDPLRYAAYVAFFPQLVAGPISRAESLVPQLGADRPPPSGREVATGLALILRGLVRKVVIADPLASVVARGFDDPGGAAWVTVAASVVAFAIQIYGDFAGYTDIARGSGRLFGIELVRNFRQPYLSRSVTEFWRRWHLSLSRWLRDYLYVPLGGNRGGPRRTAVNLGLTMVLGGLWHGAAWTFLAWGALHGAYLVVERAAGIGTGRAVEGRGLDGRIGEVRASRSADGSTGGSSGGWPGRAASAGALVATFVAVCAAWVLFRADSLADAGAVFAALGSPGGGPVVAGDLVLLAFAAGLSLAFDLLERTGSRQADLAVRRPVLAGALTGAAVVALVVFSGATTEPFIYFQF